MTCEVLKCVNNDGGYCPMDNYMKIEEDGTCSKMCILTEGEDDE